MVNEPLVFEPLNGILHPTCAEIYCTIHRPTGMLLIMNRETIFLELIEIVSEDNEKKLYGCVATNTATAA